LAATRPKSHRLVIVIKGRGANGVIAAQLFTIQHFFYGKVLSLFKLKSVLQFCRHIKLNRNTIVCFFLNFFNPQGMKMDHTAMECAKDKEGLSTADTVC
jgi:hypothetical protein